MEGVSETINPVIVQASTSARKYASAYFLRHLISAAIEESPTIPIVVHEDLGALPTVCWRSVKLGFGSLSTYGSLFEDQKTPAR